MADVTLDINGTTYTAVNAATESTLREILHALGGSATVGKNAAANLAGQQNRQAQLIKILNTSIGDNVKNFDELASTTKKAGFSMRGLGNAAASAAESFGNSLKRLTDSNMSARDAVEAAGAVAGGSLEAVGSGADLAGDALTAFGGRKMRIFGKALEIAGIGLETLGKLTPALTGMLGTALGSAEGFLNTYQKITDTGMVASEGFENLMDTANSMNLTLGQMADFVQRNREALATFGGSVTNGTNRVAALGKTIKTSNLENQFVALGITAEELPDYLLDFQAGLRGAKVDLNMKETAQAALELAGQQKTLANLTGKSVEELKKEGEQRALNTQVQSALLTLSEKFPDAYKTFEETTSVVSDRFGEAGVNAFNDLLANGRATTQQTAVWLSQNSGANKAFLEMISAMQQGTVRSGNAVDATATTMRKFDQEILSNQKVLAEYGKYVQAQEGPLGVALENLGGVIKKTQGSIAMSDEEFTKTLKAQKDARATDETGKLLDPALQAMANVNQLSQSLKKSLQNMDLELTQLVGGPGGTAILGAFRESIEALTSSIIGAVEKITGENATKSTTQEVGGTVGENIGAVAGGVGGVAASAGTGSLAGGAIGALIGGIAGLFAGGVGAIPGAAAGWSIGSGAGGLAGGAYGLYEESPWGDQTGTKVGASIGKWLFETIIGGVEGAIEGEVGSSSGNIDPMGSGWAKGGIVSGPRSGYMELLHGTEAIVPLPDGRNIPVNLNVDYSQLIAAVDGLSDPVDTKGIERAISKDNSSQYLQKLIESSSGTNQLLLSLNTQMGTLSSNFEKLVYEQRQANRLAV
jgi:hypothetical protein